MATIAARPLPTVLQTKHVYAVRRNDHTGSNEGLDKRNTRSRALSYSSVSAESSDPHSSESWFQHSASFSSQSSHYSTPPLPKGARPPSPHPIRAYHDLPPFSAFNSTTSPANHRRTRSSSGTWRVRWRDVSKIVKWSALSDPPPPIPKDITSDQQQRVDYRRISDPKTAESATKPLPRAPSTEARTASTTALSPSTLTSALDLTYGTRNVVAQSDLGHDATNQRASDIAFPSLSQIPLPVLPRDGHGSSSHLKPNGHHVWNRSVSVTNVQEVTSFPEHSSSLENEQYDSVYPLSDSGHSYAVDDQVPNSNSLGYRATQSDFGHGNWMPTNSPAVMSSYSLVENGSAQRASEASKRFPSLTKLQSTPSLPVSIDSLSSSTTLQRPRKLRKSMRSPSAFRSPHRVSSNLIPSPASFGPPASRWPFYTAILSTPISPKTHRRPTRKLVKRTASGSSSPLPPLPINRSESSENPPPVPPKSIFSLSYKTEAKWVPQSLLPLSCDGNCSQSKCKVPVEKQLHQRPSFLRSESNRRWTVAVAEVPDEIFVEELERLRRMGMRAGELHASSDRLVEQGVPLYARSSARQQDCMSWKVDVGKMALSDSTMAVELVEEDDLEWIDARRALLCCRELVRTERSYLARLQELVEGNVSDSVPQLLLDYLPTLMQASKMLSSHFNEDPSAFGVCNAFLTVEAVLESAFVAWCKVVGEFFGGQRTTPPRKYLRRTSTPEIIEEEGNETEEKQRVLPRARTSSISIDWLFRPAFLQTQEGETESNFMAIKKSLRFSFSGQAKKRSQSYRELAILPTQRVTRYVLLYKDLLKHTPLSSPTRELVEKTVASASILAKKCNNAQDNAAFLYF